MADEEINPEEEPRPMSQDEIDDLFRQLQDEQNSTKHTPAESQEPAAEEKEETGPLGQADIDALLNEMNNEDAADTAAEADSSEAEAEANDGPLGQSDIDALLNQMGVGDADEPAAENKPEPEPEADSGPLGQDDIDALLNQMNGEEPAAETVAPESEPEQAPNTTMDQSDIDALLNQMGVTDEEPQAKKEEADEVTGPLGQDDIDALLNQMNAGDDGADTPANAAETLIQEDAPVSMDQDDIDSLVNQMTGEDPAASPDDSAAADAEAMIGQDDIDKLLVEMGIDESNNSPLLSTEQIVGIVNNQAEDDGNEDEAMINQDDIDALVREMSEATGVPDQDQLDAKIVDQEEDIEALLEEAASPMATVDAVKGSIVFGQNAPAQTTSIDNAAVMAPDELRGTKYLLVAAVFLLAMCAVTMGFVVSSINDLAIELEQNRASEIKPLDDFQENIAFAKKMLAGNDNMEIVQGIKFVTQLKENYDKDPEKVILLSLLLADHYRSKGAYSKAQKEFVNMTERQGVLYEDAQHYLDYADTLFMIGEQHYDEATNILYRLLANEYYYLGDEDSQGESRLAEEVKRNQRIVQEAYLMLGRIYTAQLDRNQTRRDS